MSADLKRTIHQTLAGREVRVDVFHAGISQSNFFHRPLGVLTSFREAGRRPSRPPSDFVICGSFLARQHHYANATSKIEADDDQRRELESNESGRDLAGEGAGSRSEMVRVR